MNRWEGGKGGGNEQVGGREMNRWEGGKGGGMNRWEGGKGGEYEQEEGGREMNSGRVLSTYVPRCHRGRQQLAMLTHARRTRGPEVPEMK